MSKKAPKKNRDTDKLPPPTRAQRLAAFGFLGAFGLTVLTVLLTGLRVGAPAAGHVLHPVPPAPESVVPSAERGAPPGLSRATSSAPAAALPSVDESHENDDAARDDARDHDDGARKSSRRDADDSRAHDAR